MQVLPNQSARKKRRKQRRNLEKIIVLGFAGFALLWIVVVLFLMVQLLGMKQKEGVPVSRFRGVLPKRFSKEKDTKLSTKEIIDAKPSQEKPLHRERRRGEIYPHESPLLIFTCHRENYLKETLDDVLKYIPKDCSMGCPIIVSQDGTDDAVSGAINEYMDKFQMIGVPLLHWQHEQTQQLRSQNGYKKLAVHYGWALKKVFESETTEILLKEHSPKRVVILEEDIHVSPDFFGYFKATAPILDQDFTLLAVSAFNDNGYTGKIKDPARVLRSDFFPGLGWMMTRQLWDTELKSKWPSGYWDDWLREPVQRKGRHIIRPEVSRTFHFGSEGGTSGNQFGGNLASIELEKTPVDWEKEDLKFLSPPESYNADYLKLIRSARTATLGDVDNLIENGNVRVEYRNFRSFQSLATSLGLMTDEKAGIPRTAYLGVVETRPKGNHILFLTPPLETLAKELSA